MTQDQRTYQRAASAALIGLGVQLLATIALLVLGLYSVNDALQAATWYAGGGIAVWACLWIVYQQHKLERIEALEAEQLAAQHGADSSIFEVSADDLSVARRRLRWLYKWVVPVVSLTVATYLIVIGAWLASHYATALREGNYAVPASALGLSAFTVGLAVVGFLLSRYMAGMARHPAWNMLSAGAAYLMGAVLAAVLITAGLIAAHSDFPALLAYSSVIIPVAMIAVGVEFAVNFILEIYRPRKPGELPRPAFDSRVLGLLCTPGSIANTISEAINYQLGFEITTSWFWRLLSKAFLWLIGFGILVLLLISCLVIVEPNQQALITRFGRLVHDADTPALGPGLHLKMPWPISSARYYDVTTVRAMRLGSARHLKSDVPILWTNEHYEGAAEPLLVAAPRTRDAGTDALAPDNGDGKRE